MLMRQGSLIRAEGRGRSKSHYVTYPYTWCKKVKKGKEMLPLPFWKKITNREGRALSVQPGDPDHLLRRPATHEASRVSASSSASVDAGLVETGHEQAS